MPVLGVRDFNSFRLSQARNARGLSAVNLADLIGVSPTSISLYENGKQFPKQSIVEDLARALNVPIGFFVKEVAIEKPSNLFYRSMKSATKASRMLSEAKYEWALETIDYLLGFFDFPRLNLPDFEVPKDYKSLDNRVIESYANQLREFWNLGLGPITSMVRTLESNGIITWRTKFDAETQDAFSEFRTPHPVVVLSSDKDNFYRSRFDAAHELGHLVLHRHVEQSTLRKSAEFDLLERQAHLFAAAFLLPAAEYSKDLWTVSLDTFRSLKPRWNVSIAMQIMRSKQLGLINDAEEKRLWINLNRRKWKKVEPLDDSTVVEKPKLIHASIKMLVNEKVKSKEQLVEDLQLSASDIEIMIEEPGFIRSLPAYDEPSLKNRKIIPFRRA